jgi:hypothetical protein
MNKGDTMDTNKSPMQEALDSLIFLRRKYIEKSKDIKQAQLIADFFTEACNILNEIQFNCIAQTKQKNELFELFTANKRVAMETMKAQDEAFGLGD